jgi:hypothetical protein
MVVVFNATFNNISVISWQSALLVEETRGKEKGKTKQNNNNTSKGKPHSWEKTIKL